MDIPELANFVPRASTSQSGYFPLDPALAGPSQSSSSRQSRRDNYWQQDDDDDLDQDEYEDSGEGEGEYDSEEESEPERQQQHNAKRTRPASQAGVRDGATQTTSSVAKGKAKAVDQDDLNELGEADEEDLGSVHLFHPSQS
jgi:hypothetical protein